ncbi:hypothetical protein L2672_14090 [Shewanella gaetbuli]|uniref:Uncharacterized protein n=1 Tax=Shewanella gaetbuli TaxID=220752 RepID=A0A9X2CHR3_9GAMM|nr:hypothetical protein [Shewanella gaetbuli]
MFKVVCGNSGIAFIPP